MQPCGQLPWNSFFDVSRTRPFQSVFNLNTIPLEQITIQGLQVDVLERVMAPWTPDPIEGCNGDHVAILKYLSEVQEICEESNRKFAKTGFDVYANAFDRDLAHILIPVADQEQYGNKTRRASRVSRDAYKYTVRSNQLRLPRTNANSTKVERSYQMMMDWQRYRRPFISDQGYVGLAPDYAKEGDVVVIFLGAKFPYILRKNDDGTHHFVGEAYVHGIMYGEFMERDRKTVEFILR